MQQSKSTNINGNLLSKSFILGLSCYTKFITAPHDKQTERRSDDTLMEIMHELKIPLAECFSPEYFSNEYYKSSANIPLNQMELSMNSIAQTLGERYGELASDVFAFGFRFLPWIINDKLRHDINEKTKMLTLMQKIALPERFISKIVSINENNGAQCRDALIQYFKNHLEHTEECPNCFALIAPDYSQCPVCKTTLKKFKKGFSIMEAIKSLFR